MLIFLMVLSCFHHYYDCILSINSYVLAKLLKFLQLSHSIMVSFSFLHIVIVILNTFSILIPHFCGNFCFYLDFFFFKRNSDILEKLNVWIPRLWGNVDISQYHSNYNCTQMESFLNHFPTYLKEMLIFLIILFNFYCSCVFTLLVYKPCIATP